MKIEKAIEILSQDLTYTYPAKFDDLQDAIKLGIEAMKAIQKGRAFPYLYCYPELPGEDSFIDPTRSSHHIKKVLESPLGIEPKG